MIGIQSVPDLTFLRLNYLILATYFYEWLVVSALLMIYNLNQEQT